MCFSTSANFIGSAVLGTVGVMTLVEVKHRRELLFAALPCLFALHQFTERFVWLGLDGKLPPILAHDAGAAYILYAQGLLPYEFTSIWCAYAAVVSVVVCFFFRNSRSSRPAEYASV